jgi:hypothetical protein
MSPSRSRYAFSVYTGTLLAVSVLVVATLSACHKNEEVGSEGAAETAGKQIDRAAAEAGRELKQAAQDTGKALEKAGVSIQEKAQEKSADKSSDYQK